MQPSENVADQYGSPAQQFRRECRGTCVDDPISAEKHAYQIRAGGAEQVARHVYDNDYSGGEFQIQVLLETDQDYHRHREDGEEQFIAYARF